MTRRLLEVLALVGGIALIFGAGLLWGRELEVREHLAARVRAETTRDALRDSLRVATAIVRVDSVTVDRQVTRWRVVRDSLVDTVRVTDTVALLVQVADSTIGACVAGAARCREALAIATRARATDSILVDGMRIDLQLALARATQAEGRSWRYRAEGMAACAAGVWGLSRVRR